MSSASIPDLQRAGGASQPRDVSRQHPRATGSLAALRRLAERALPPILAFALARGIVLLIGAIIRVNAAVPDVWITWDSGIYRSISQHGYTLVAAPGKPSGLDGSAGWFPLYPWLVRGCVQITGMHHDVAMLLLPAIFCMMSLLLLWDRFIVPAIHDRRDRWLCLLTAAVFPGMIYQHAPFPIAQTTFFILLHLHLMRTQSWTCAGLAAALAGMSHPMGSLLAGTSLLWAMRPCLQRDEPIDRRGALLACALACLGGFAVLLSGRIAVGAWDAYFAVQSNFQHTIQNPLSVLWHHLRTLGQSYRFQPPSHQTLLLTLMMLQLAATLIPLRRRLSGLDRLLSVFAAVCFVFPLCISFVAEYRAHATLLPCALLLRHVPRRTQALLLLLCLVVAIEMSWRYLLGRVF